MTTQESIIRENATRTAMGGVMSTEILRGQIEKYGSVEITTENVEFAAAVERSDLLRLRRWCGLEATHPLVADGGYPAGYRMLRDMDASEQPQIGDFLVRQYGQVG